MTTFGCHSCSFDPTTYKGDWEHCPCATCKLGLDYSHTFNTGFFDTGKADELEGDFKFEEEHEFVRAKRTQLSTVELRSLEMIKDAIEKQMYLTFSGMLMHMLHIAKTNPTMFEVVIKKLQNPYMSYSDIGDSMEPKCSKQNVLYHLKSAVAEFPDLEPALLTDTRYSSGHYALKTIADKKRDEFMKNKLKANLYGMCPQITKPMDINDINRILKMPFLAREDIFSFDPYVMEEKELKARREETRKRLEAEQADRAEQDMHNREDIQ